MPLTKAEKFKLLSGGQFGPPAEDILRTSTNRDVSSQSSATILRQCSDWPDPKTGIECAGNALGSEDGFALEKKSPARLTPHLPTEVKERVPAGIQLLSNKLGQLASPGLSFCPVQAVSKYPYKYIHNKALQDVVASSFFAGGKFFERSWDIFYIHPPPDVSPKPLLLLPLVQVLSFFDVINKEAGSSLRVPPKSDDCGFQVCFLEMDNTPGPRHLGESTCRNDFQILEQMVPAPMYRPDGETPDPPPSERSLAAFKRKIQLACEATKNKSKASRAKKQKERIERQHGWRRQIKRTQRYLGLKKRLEREELEQVLLREPGTSDYLDVESPAPHPMESSVVFVSIDVESFERDHKKITEVGISVLDTNDLSGIPPGKGGSGWVKRIQTRHLRIKEHAHLINKDFVTGCADRFEFGESEWVSLEEAPSIIAESFRFPTIDQTQRNIILLGHGIDGDIEYLKAMGYNPFNLHNLVEVLDTSVMYRYLKREQNPRSLGSVLSDLDIMGWNLHNAGNDAAYTLQAMLAIAVKGVTERSGSIDWAEEKRKRVGEAAKEAVERALEYGEGWSSTGESDGGVVERKWIKKPTYPPRGTEPKNAQKREQKSSSSSDRMHWGGVSPK
ncbi:hypothetical protein FGG08_006044 [Glutinoglossum americanum]|uniref:Gfd2/YDR514C-like C-terminal domain-containing protein n=1 Tax=Glutinoglossum americanum TaxID=1670608 RepID=A0A9P8I873_9PEZI|nr:hypothetical protein FGG08_006044 [Glutinoglossum americanum]